MAAGGRESSIIVTPATGLILNDDTPRIMVFNRGITETNSGQTAMVFDVALVKPQGHAATVTVSATSGTATSGIDFQPTSQSLTFTGTGAANSIEILPFTVPINSDRVAELDESFSVVLSNLQASGDVYALANGTGIIYNDDLALFRVDVPSLIAVDDPAQPQVIAATYNSVDLSLLDFKLGLIGGSDAQITGNLTVRAVGSGSSPAPQPITFSGDPNQKISIAIPSTIANDDTQWLTISLTNINSNGRDTQGNQVWFIALRPAADPNHQLCVGALPIDDFRNTGLRSQAPIPILIHIEEYAGPDGLLYGRWVTADGTQVPGVGYYNGNIYTDDPTLVPDLQHAVVGDIGFGQDTYGYAIVPVTVNRQVYLQGSVDRLNYGSVEAFNNARAAEAKARLLAQLARSQNGPGRCVTSGSATPPPNPTQSVEAIHAEWVIPYNKAFTFNPFPTFNYRLNTDPAVTIQKSNGDIALIGETVALAYGTVVANADNTLTYTPYSDLPSRTVNGLRPEKDALGNIFRFTGIENFDAHIVSRSLLVQGNLTSCPVMFASTPVRLAVANTLPTSLASQSRTRTNQASNPDSPVFAELNTSYTIDLHDMFADFDGLADVNRLTIVDVLYGTEKLDMTTDPNDPLKKDHIRTKFEFRLAKLPVLSSSWILT